MPRLKSRGISLLKKYRFQQAYGADDVLFLLPNKKRTKRNQPKGRYENAPPLETPAATPSDFRKCPDFRKSTLRKLSDFSMQVFKNRDIFGHRSAMRRVGYAGEGAFFVAPPLRRLLSVPFLAAQERNISALPFYKNVYFFDGLQRPG